MRARIVVVGFCVVVLAAGALAVSQRLAGDATAQEQEVVLPLFYAEIAGWCSSACAPRFVELPDGYVRVVLADSAGTKPACQPMALPEDVEGWALVAAAGEQATPAAGDIVAIDEVRKVSSAAICELIVARL
jgi:hypothetical protein